MRAWKCIKDDPRGHISCFDIYLQDVSCGNHDQATRTNLAMLGREIFSFLSSRCIVSEIPDKKRQPVEKTYDITKSHHFSFRNVIRSSWQS